MDKELTDALNFDSLLEAEEITGNSYKDDKATSALGMLLNMEHSKIKEEVLSGRRDLSRNCTFKYMEEILVENGFELLLEDEFDYKFYGNSVEKCQIWWHKEFNIAAWTESYGREKVNEVKFYGNCKIPFDSFSLTSNGGRRAYQEIMDRDAEYFKVCHAKRILSDYDEEQEALVTNEEIADHLKITVEEVTAKFKGRTTDDEWTWVGSWSSEGFMSIMKEIDEVGEWVEWVAHPFMWFVNYSESKVKGYDNEEITSERISRLPQEVQDMINYKH